MKPFVALLLMIAAFYRPHAFEDSPRWSPDPMRWESGRALPFEVTAWNANGTVDGIATGIDGRKHQRLNQRVLKGVDAAVNDGGSGVILRERGS